MVQKEKYLKDYPISVPLELTTKIIKQMKNSICKIYIEGSEGTGFFCKLPFNNTLLPVLITNNHVINDETLKKNNKLVIYMYKEPKEEPKEKPNKELNKEKFKELELEERITYTNKDYDITIIEIKEKDGIKNYLELDENIRENSINTPYINESIYIIQYEEKEEKPSVSYGILQNIDKENLYLFKHLCNTKPGSSGSPILNLKTGKIIGIHIGAHTIKNYNFGNVFKLSYKKI